MPISKFTSEFRDKSLECRYRESCWEEWTARYLSIASICAFFYIAGFYIDYLLVGPGDSLWTFAAIRVFFAATCMGAALLLGKSSYRPELDFIVFSVLLICSICTNLIIALSPGGMWPHSLTIMVFVLIYYIFVPNRSLLTTANGICATVGFLAVGMTLFPPRNNELAAIVLYLILANILGALIATRTHRLNRLQYAGLVAEQNSNALLRKEIESRKKAQKESIESAQRFKRLVELSPEGIVVHRKGKVLYANTAALRLMRVDKLEKLPENDISRFIHPEYHEITEQRIRELERNKQALPPADIQLVRPHGEVIVCEVVSGWTTFQGKPAIQSIIRDITKRKRLERKLKKLAETDFLTGALNRRMYMELSKKEFERARRYHRSLSVVIIDIDHFKTINDSYGHAIGDEALKYFVGHCLKTIRMHDIFGRFGGEEFALTLPETSLDAAIKASDRIKNFTCLRPPLGTDRNEIHFTVSMGITECILDGETFEDCLKRADKALYTAKERGRNRIVAIAAPAVEN